MKKLGLQVFALSKKNPDNTKSKNIKITIVKCFQCMKQIVNVKVFFIVGYGRTKRSLERDNL